eukprot:TRINITY_DN1345_c0_g1_i1.p1 TRINITY_DN1345_c0_g1~~TRINITY_DN1345_c0_g1_i1.p1  ORF type:complete len:184 (+),score=65.55 TRINITY_DN1345_c0_g1_i1:28-552(+)
MNFDESDEEFDLDALEPMEDIFEKQKQQSTIINDLRKAAKKRQIAQNQRKKEALIRNIKSSGDISEAFITPSYQNHLNQTFERNRKHEHINRNEPHTFTQRQFILAKEVGKNITNSWNDENQQIIAHNEKMIQEYNILYRKKIDDIQIKRYMVEINACRSKNGQKLINFSQICS